MPSRRALIGACALALLGAVWAFGASVQLSTLKARVQRLEGAPQCPAPAKQDLKKVPPRYWKV